MKALVAYVPVLHAGYLRMFRKHSDAVLYLLGQSITKDFPSLVRNLPGVDPQEIRKMLNGLDIFWTEERRYGNVRIMEKDNFAEVATFETLIMPDEDVSRSVAAQFFIGRDVAFEDWRLRWDWKAATASKRPEVETVISHSEFDRSLMAQALGIAQKSPDWWRQIGALLVKKGKVLLVGFNTHLPHEQSAYAMGDPRSNFEPGQHIDVSLALHAEAGVIAEAARRGISTEDCDLYVTTFPCPNCAGPVAISGIKRLYYIDGYSRVEGAAALVSRGIQIVRVEMQNALAPV